MEGVCFKMTEKQQKNKITKIIIEGPDCSGKSTLADRLKNRLHWDSKYLRHKKGDQFTRYLKEYAEKEIIFDRAHFSEEVYSQIWRGGSPFTEKEKNLLDEVAEINSLIIFALPPLGEMHSRYKSRNFDQQISLKELDISKKLFNGEAKKVKKIIYHSRNFEELEQLLDKIDGMVR